MKYRENASNSSWKLPLYVESHKHHLPWVHIFVFQKLPPPQKKYANPTAHYGCISNKNFDKLVIENIISWKN